MTEPSRDVLEQLADAVKWWNADEAEEPDVRRLFAACKAEIERLRLSLSEERSSGDARVKAAVEQRDDAWRLVGEIVEAMGIPFTHDKPGIVKAQVIAAARQVPYAEDRFEQVKQLIYAMRLYEGFWQNAERQLVMEIEATIPDEQLIPEICQTCGDTKRDTLNPCSDGFHAPKGSHAVGNPQDDLQRMRDGWMHAEQALSMAEHLLRRVDAAAKLIPENVEGYMEPLSDAIADARQFLTKGVLSQGTIRPSSDYLRALDDAAKALADVGMVKAARVVDHWHNKGAVEAQMGHAQSVPQEPTR